MNLDIISNAPSTEFKGVFYFTNATDEDFKVAWNSIEYTFPAQTTSPLLISQESPENVQAIRKVFAKKLAVREFHKSSDYSRLVELGKGNGTTYDESILEKWIEECLKPLPTSTATTKQLPKVDDSIFGDKIEPVEGGESLIEKGKRRTSSKEPVSI